MDSKLISFIAASFTSLMWTSLPSIVSTLLLLICAGLLIRQTQHLAIVLLGIVWMASLGHWQHSLQLSSEQTSQPVQIIGKVSSLVIAQRNIRFNLSVRQIDQQRLFYPITFRLSWRDPQWQVQQGQRIKLLVKVKPPHGLANEAGFHYQQWLFSQGIIATGYVKFDIDNQLIDPHKTTRQQLLNKLLSYDLRHSSWIAALTFGYRGMLQPQDWQLVQKTGVAHLIAISGLHLALVASLSYLVIAWIGGGVVSRFNRLHHINLHSVAMILTLLTTFVYAALAGFGLPTLRAWLMLLLFTLLFLINKTLTAKRLILLGLCSFILLFPLSIFGLSFWLSFTAVSIIGFVFWRWPVKKSGFSLQAMLLTMLKVQLSLTFLMLPLVAWQFSYVSVVSPLINLIAVPVVTMILVPLCLLGAMGLMLNFEWAQAVFSLTDHLLGYGLTFLNYWLAHDFAYFSLAKFSLAVWLCFLLFVLGCCLPALWINKKVLCLLLLPLASQSLLPKNNLWQIDILDVGQGVAVLISKNNRVVIYDVGASYPSGFNMADSVLLPILQARGVSQVDLVLISHDDNDHSGSLPQLLNGVTVTKVLTNQTNCQQGLDFVWQGLRIQAFWPDNVVQYSDNNGSCVIKISDQFHSILLPGDIDKSIEKKLVDSYSQLIAANILLAPHHGSNTSSSVAFINQVKPQYVVFSQGFMNRWRFPREEVVSRYQAFKPYLFSTSDAGQVSFLMEYNVNTPIKVKTFRHDIYPKWYANFPR